MIYETEAQGEMMITDDEMPTLYRSADGALALTREGFLAIASERRDFDILCRDSKEGILPFLVAEEGSYEEAMFDLGDESGITHVDPRLPVPSRFGIADDDSLLELSSQGRNGITILGRFHWCVLVPLGDGPSGDAHELRFATTTPEDAEFVAETFGCADPVIVPIYDEAFEVV